MRQAAYLSKSRHGIFYFRQPIPTHAHPDQIRTDVKISLSTRSPRTAFALSRLLSGYGQSLCIAATFRGMKYQDIRAEVRSHFKELLAQFRAGVADGGPVRGQNLEVLRASERLAESGLSGWLAATYPDGSDGPVRAFCEVRGIAGELSSEQENLLLSELHKGYKSYLSAALNHNASFSGLNLENEASLDQRSCSPDKKLPEQPDATPFMEVVEQYFSEVDRANALAAKTRSEKQDALKLLGEITGYGPLSELEKGDARKIKGTLLKLPKNRSKSLKTRGLKLNELLKLKDVEVISARTVNAYISNMQSFLKWAVNNGHAEQNVFTGMRVTVSKKTSDQLREAFTSDQLNTLFEHLTLNPHNLVKKDEHKWGALIGMFTGMRLNEVAQLEVSDIVNIEGVWCIDVTEDGDANKRLKNATSNRRVPIHHQLIDCGLLDFIERQRRDANKRVFPKLTYTAQNGYGRNIGRWFNEKLLPALGMKTPGLVYHSLRHTMATRLNQSDAPESKVKAILGYAQSGVTFSVYFKEGFKPSQLKKVIDGFEF